MGIVMSIFHVAQACLSTYSGFLSYTAITKLQTYEAKSEKAAQYSDTAARELFKTRTTQASGAIATLSSFASSLALASLALKWQNYVMLIVFNLVATSFAYKHMSSFWAAKGKVPFVRDFNDAITTSNQMLSALAALTLTWGFCCLIYGFQLV